MPATRLTITVGSRRVDEAWRSGSEAVRGGWVVPCRGRAAFAIVITPGMR
jgi:hypothetical protein